MSQTYSKSSFDRFGDDLCELILSYLSFNDKIRSECVSTQFCRSVYQKQYELTINETFFIKLKKTGTLGNERTDLKAFKVFIKKLTSLKKLSIKYNTFWCEFSNFLQIIELTLKYCEYLKEIEIDFIHITDEKVNKLFRKLGPHITKAIFSSKESWSFGQTYCITNLSNCTSLKELNIMNIDRLFHGKNNCLVKCLNKITFFFTNWDMDSFEIFVDCNKHSLETVEVFFTRFIQPIPLSSFLSQVTKLTNLRKLKITFLDFYTFSIVENLVEISQKCPKLEDFNLLFYSQTIDPNIDLFNTMKNFKNLKKLTLKLYSGFIPEIPFLYTSQLFSELPLLTHLTFRANVNSIKDVFFEDIGKHIPNLRFLNVWDANITDKALTSITELKYLKELTLATTFPTKIIEHYFYALIECCPNIRSVYLENFETLDVEEFISYAESLCNSSKMKYSP